MDLTQDGHAWCGCGKDALQAHVSWGFEEIKDKKMIARRRRLYARSSAVKLLFMKIGAYRKIKGIFA